MYSAAVLGTPALADDQKNNAQMLFPAGNDQLGDEPAVCGFKTDEASMGAISLVDVDD